MREICALDLVNLATKAISAEARKIEKRQEGSIATLRVVRATPVNVFWGLLRLVDSDFNLYVIQAEVSEVGKVKLTTMCVDDTLLDPLSEILLEEADYNKIPIGEDE